MFSDLHHMTIEECYDAGKVLDAWHAAKPVTPPGRGRR